MTLAETSGGLTTLDAAALGLYLAVMLFMGFWIARKNASTDDFFLGGRDLPAWAVGISLIASLLSTITYLGMPGEMFRTGIGFLTRQLGLPLVLLIVWFVWLPFFMKLKLTSAYEYLERRFNYPTRAIAAVFCICLLLGWIAVVVLTASSAMVEIANLRLGWFFSSDPYDADMHAMIVGIGLFSILYTTLGGLRAVVWTDVVQFFVLLGGAVFTVGTVAWTTGTGPGDWIAFSRQYKHEQVEWFDWNVANRSTVFSIAIGMVFWHACTHGANQVALQRYFSVRDVSSARRSFLVNALSSVGLGMLLAVVGVSLMYFVLGDHSHGTGMEATRASLVLDVENAAPEDVESLKKERTKAQDRVFPQFIRMYLPSGLRGLVIAALFAAAMSTIDSGANSISTIVTIDFVRPLRREALTTRGELRLARILTASMGLIVVTTTIGLYHLAKGTNMIDLCQKGFNCFLGPLGALFVLAMFSKRATPATVIPAVLAGEAIGIGSSYSVEFLGIPFSTHLVVPASWLTTIVVSMSLGLLLRTQSDAESRRWMWRAVVS
ncbi:MAG: sodium/solute symporter, partial [Planctomycetota bacterium]|nr:sodium/solute symporter [Planctomycetota bacterium]